MIKVGLIGEAPSDTNSIINLLKPIYKEHVIFFTLVNDIHGSQLDNQKTKRFLRKEFENEKPEIVVFIRDLDALETDNTQQDLRKKYFSENNSVVNSKGIFLLNIFEIEALILTDINTFNQLYNTNIEYLSDPMLEPLPKEFLIKKTKNPLKYSETDNPIIFSNLNFEQLKSCRYFSKFIAEFEKLIYK
jgi:hypothetical protein